MTVKWPKLQSFTLNFFVVLRAKNTKIGLCYAELFKKVARIFRHTVYKRNRGKSNISINCATDDDVAKARRTCTNLSVYEGCTTIPLLPGIGLGEDTVCYCSTDYCNNHTLPVTSCAAATETLLLLRAVCVAVLLVVITIVL